MMQNTPDLVVWSNVAKFNKEKSRVSFSLLYLYLISLIHLWLNMHSNIACVEKNNKSRSSWILVVPFFIKGLHY